MCCIMAVSVNKPLKVSILALRIPELQPLNSSTLPCTASFTSTLTSLQLTTPLWCTLALLLHTAPTVKETHKDSPKHKLVPKSELRTVTDHCSKLFCNKCGLGSAYYESPSVTARRSEQTSGGSHKQLPDRRTKTGLKVSGAAQRATRLHCSLQSPALATKHNQFLNGFVFLQLICSLQISKLCHRRIGDV